MRFFLSVLFVMLAFCSEAQEQEGWLLGTGEKLAVQRMKELKDGWLIVVLREETNKIEAMENVLEGEVSKSTRKRLEKSIKRTQEQERARHAGLKEAFYLEYKFSKYAFLLSGDVETFLADRQAKILEDPAGERMSLPQGEDYFFLIQERGSAEDNTNATFWQVQNRDFHPLAHPFPNNFTVNIAAFNRRQSEVVEGINRKFSFFYEDYRWYTN